MPRTARVQFEGARYHVINRGNYRKDLFLTHKTSDAFSQVLFEACDRFSWKLHAYVLMSNHYHLCLETPQANLGDGMHWLQSTFANKFSRFTGERGHVFQGRYKSLVIEGDYGLLAVADYIHLNPVRARVIEVNQLREYPNSSFPKYFSKYRPSCLVNETFLHEAGGLKPTPAGMRAYHNRLKLIMAGSPQEREAAFKDLSRGWFIGSKEGRQHLANQIQKGAAQANAETKIRLQTIQLKDQLKVCLKQLSKTAKDVRADPKSAPWKLAIASYLKSSTGLKNPQLCAMLNLGHPATMSNHVSIYNQTRKRKCPYYAKLQIQNS
jgi:putative transposase